jgi:hypothetical protein
MCALECAESAPRIRLDQCVVVVYAADVLIKAFCLMVLRAQLFADRVSRAVCAANQNRPQPYQYHWRENWTSAHAHSN